MATEGSAEQERDDGIIPLSRSGNDDSHAGTVKWRDWEDKRLLKFSHRFFSRAERCDQ
jgi:hypothetical protein